MKHDDPYSADKLQRGQRLMDEVIRDNPDADEATLKTIFVARCLEDEELAAMLVEAVRYELIRLKQH